MSKKKAINTRIPMVFEVLDGNDDSRFLNVKIWLMHLGVNYNNSYFSKEVVEEYANTIKNTPLLGFIEEGKLGKDFKGHEEVLVVKDGDITTKYLGSAYGIIPESCNPRFEFKLGDDGLLREYLVVDGLMWTKFQDAVDIISEDGEVGQSLEIHDKDFDGYWDENDIFVFTKFKFDGACMLGKNVQPAMQRASVERMFNVNNIKLQIEEKLEEYNKYIEKKYSKEVEILNLDEILAKYSMTNEILLEKGLDVSQYSLEELEDKIKDMLDNQDDNQDNDDNQDEGSDNTDNADEGSDDNTDEGGVEGSDEGSSENADEGSSEGSDGSADTNFEKVKGIVSDKIAKKFELSHSDLRWKLYEGLDEHIQSTTGTSGWHYVQSVYDNYFIVEDDSENSYFKVSYSKADDNISLGDVIQVFPMFLTSDEKGALDLMRSSIATYEAENKELKQFKMNVEKEQHEYKAEELFGRFSNLEEDDLKDLRECVSKYSIEELESKTYEILGRKMATMQNNKFSRKEKQPASFKFSQKEEDAPASIVDKYFEKHGFAEANK